jgi:hypothetical protein
MDLAAMLRCGPHGDFAVTVFGFVSGGQDLVRTFVIGCVCYVFMFVTRLLFIFV